MSASHGAFKFGSLMIPAGRLGTGGTPPDQARVPVAAAAAAAEGIDSLTRDCRSRPGPGAGHGARPVPVTPSPTRDRHGDSEWLADRDRDGARLGLRDSV